MRRAVPEGVEDHAVSDRPRFGLLVALLALAALVLVLLLSVLMVRPRPSADSPSPEHALLPTEEAVADIGAQLVARLVLPPAQTTAFSEMVPAVEATATVKPTEIMPPPAAPVMSGNVLASPEAHRDSRVFVHYSSRSSGGQRAAAVVADHLQAAGQTVAEIRVVSFAIAQARVRFFFAGDASRAQEVAHQMAAIAGGPVRIEAFTWFRPLPSPGVIEVWLPGGTDLAAR
jgi:hypothetical protein